MRESDRRAAETLTDDATPFDTLDQALQEGGAPALLDALVEALEARGEPRPLLDALLLRARHDLALPAAAPGSLAELPEPLRTQYEDRTIEALRRVGRRQLDAGDIAGAWPYYRALGEREPIAEALDAARLEPGDAQVGALIEVAFQQGAHPRRGFELILEHYGTCSAITAFGQLPMDEPIRAACAARLVRNVHEQLAANLRADLVQRGRPEPPESATIPDLLAAAAPDDLLADEAYHVDVSHLASVVRMAPLLNDAETLALAADLCAYGRRLSPRLRLDDAPPFERTYDDHGLFLNALLGRDADVAIAHFRGKLPTTGAEEDGEPDTLAAQVLVQLLARLGRLAEAIDVAAAHLAGVPEAYLACPSLARLCQQAGRLDRLAEESRAQGDLVAYAAARLGRT
jgi:hypothetical protein